MTEPAAGGVDFLDVDAAFREQDFARSPITVKVVGEMWEFPGVMPSMVPLRLARWDKDGTTDLTELPVQDALLLIGDLVSDETLAAWSARGLSITAPDGSLDPRMERILEYLLTTYMRREADIIGDDVGEAQAPPEGPAPSSGTGVVSKPTSPANTESDSPAG